MSLIYHRLTNFNPPPSPQPLSRQRERGSFGRSRPGVQILRGRGSRKRASAAGSGCRAYMDVFTASRWRDSLPRRVLPNPTPGNSRISPQHRGPPPSKPPRHPDPPGQGIPQAGFSRRKRLQSLHGRIHGVPLEGSPAPEGPTEPNPRHKQKNVKSPPKPPTNTISGTPICVYPNSPWPPSRKPRPMPR